MLQQYMRGRSHSSVPFVMPVFLKVEAWTNILKVYMRGRSYSSVSFVMLSSLKVETWKDTLQQLMRDRSHLNVLFLILTLIKMEIWKGILRLYIHEGHKFKLSTCRICNKSFRDIHALKRHQKAHKVFNLWCLFSSKSKRHIETVHEREKPFKCSICDASFGKSWNLNAHIKTVHEGKKPIKCEDIGHMWYHRFNQFLFSNIYKKTPIIFHKRKSKDKMRGCYKIFFLETLITKIIFIYRDYYGWPVTTLDYLVANHF